MTWRNNYSKIFFTLIDFIKYTYTYRVSLFIIIKMPSRLHQNAFANKTHAHLDCLTRQADTLARYLLYK